MLVHPTLKILETNFIHSHFLTEQLTVADGYSVISYIAKNEMNSCCDEILHVKDILKLQQGFSILTDSYG